MHSKNLVNKKTTEPTEHIKVARFSNLVHYVARWDAGKVRQQQSQLSAAITLDRTAWT